MDSERLGISGVYPPLLEVSRQPSLHLAVLLALDEVEDQVVIELFLPSWEERGLRLILLHDGLRIPRELQQVDLHLGKAGVGIWVMTEALLKL